MLALGETQVREFQILQRFSRKDFRGEPIGQPIRHQVLLLNKVHIIEDGEFALGAWWHPFIDDGRLDLVENSLTAGVWKAAREVRVQQSADIGKFPGRGLICLLAAAVECLAESSQRREREVAPGWNGQPESRKCVDTPSIEAFLAIKTIEGAVHGGIEWQVPESGR